MGKGWKYSGPLCLYYWATEKFHGDSPAEDTEEQTEEHCFLVMPITPFSVRRVTPSDSHHHHEHQRTRCINTPWNPNVIGKCVRVCVCVCVCVCLGEGVWNSLSPRHNKTLLTLPTINMYERMHRLLHPGAPPPASQTKHFKHGHTLHRGNPISPHQAPQCWIINPQGPDSGRIIWPCWRPQFQVLVVGTQ